MSVRKKVSDVFPPITKIFRENVFLNRTENNVVYHHLHYNIDMLECFLF